LDSDWTFARGHEYHQHRDGHYRENGIISEDRTVIVTVRFQRPQV
jgi:hypothetical protein